MDAHLTHIPSFQAYIVFGKNKEFTPETMSLSFKRLGLVLHQDQVMRLFNKVRRPAPRTRPPTLTRW